MVCGNRRHVTLFGWKLNVKQRLDDQYIQSWYSSIETSGACVNYRILKKKKITLEKYLLILPRSNAINFTKFRLGNTHRPVVAGRFSNTSYMMKDIAHYVKVRELVMNFMFSFECSFLETIRSDLLPRYYYNKPNTFKNGKAV